MLKLASSKVIPRLQIDIVVRVCFELCSLSGLPEHICCCTKVAMEHFRAKILPITFSRGLCLGASTGAPILPLLKDRKAKVADLQSALTGNEDVTWLEIEVENAKRVNMSQPLQAKRSISDTYRVSLAVA